eukprot:scaffold6711_cov118-Isochrysis_galbana.AAC.21
MAGGGEGRRRESSGEGGETGDGGVASVSQGAHNWRSMRSAIGGGAHKYDCRGGGVPPSFMQAEQDRQDRGLAVETGAEAGDWDTGAGAGD